MYIVVSACVKVAEVSKRASDMTRSIGGSCCFVTWPLAEWEPLMHWIAERRREKDRVHLSQDTAMLYD